MKKFLAVLLSVVLCATVAYSVCAEEVAPAEDVVVVAEEEASPVEDLAGQLANDEVALEKAEEIVEAIATGSTSDDIVSLLGALEQYINGAGFEVSDLKDTGAVRDVIDSFLEDAGVNSEELNNAISESTVANAVLGIYYSAPDVPVEPEDIPKTGFRG